MEKANTIKPTTVHIQYSRSNRLCQCAFAFWGGAVLRARLHPRCAQLRLTPITAPMRSPPLTRRNAVTRGGNALGKQIKSVWVTLALYPLSYRAMVTRAGFEPATSRLSVEVTLYLQFRFWNDRIKTGTVMPIWAALESNQPFFDFSSKLSSVEVTVSCNSDHWYNKQMNPKTADR